MEATIVYWSYIGRMEKKMETTDLSLSFSISLSPLYVEICIYNTYR